MFVFRVRSGVMPKGAVMKEIPWTVVINPTLTFLSEDTKLYWERCLSLPGLYGQVLRNTQLRMEAYSLDGAKYTMTTSVFLARLLQHEYDHLDGILYPMRMADSTKKFPNCPPPSIPSVDPGSTVVMGF